MLLSTRWPRQARYERQRYLTRTEPMRDARPYAKRSFAAQLRCLYVIPAHLYLHHHAFAHARICLRVFAIAPSAF